MSKYIDAEKLIAEIKRQKHELELSIQSQGDYGQSCHIVAYDNILSFIASLQQEQPSDGDDGKFVKISVRKEVAERFQRLCDEIQAGQSSFFAAISPQEQPEVDIAKEIEEYFKGWFVDEDLGLVKSDSWSCIVEDVKDVARHFFELGLNARNK